MSTPLSLVFKTTAANQTVTVNLTVANGSPYAINWDASNSSTYTSFTGTGAALLARPNTYANIGMYRVDISGTAITAFRCNSNPSRLYSVISFGTVGLTDLTETFQNCNVLTTVSGEQQMPSSIPSTVTRMGSMFRNSNVNSSNMCSWDVSGVSTMDYMFQNATSFNQPIGAYWDMRNITDCSVMFNNATKFNNGGVPFGPKWKFTLGKLGSNGISGIFWNATQFNQPIGDWGYIGIQLDFLFANCTAFNSTISFDTSSGKAMYNMFQNATNFNQDISGWNVSNASNMNNMFNGASKFNQPIGSWTPINVTNMSGMFNGATAFNQPIGSWNVSKVTNMSGMFQSATAFNQPIGSWTPINVANMSGMFTGATVFNQPLNSWNVSKVTNMSGMFQSATAFNQPLDNWRLSQLSSFSSLFQGAVAFNQSLNTWDVSGVTNMSNMFYGANTFNQPLNTWDVRNVTNMNGMFRSAISFNQDLSWNVIKVTNMSNMFNGATSFNRSLGSWNVGNVTTMATMFPGSGMSVANFDLTLNGWATLPSVKPAVPLSNVNYSLDSSASYANLTTSPKSWVITSGYYAGSRPVITNVNNNTNGVNKTITFTQSTLSPVGTSIVYYYSYDGINRLGSGISNNSATTYTFDVSSSVFTSNKSLYIIAYYPSSNPVGSLPSTTPYTINVTGSVVPVITNIVPGPNRSTITFSKNDAGWDTAPNYYYSFDGTTKNGLATYPSFTVNSLTNSTPYTLYIIASNTPNSSNTESNLYSASGTLNVYGSVPIFTLTTGTNKTTFSYSQTTGGTGTSTFYYVLNGVRVSAPSSPFDLSGLTNTPYSIYLIATNTAGDIRSLTITYSGTPISTEVPVTPATYWNQQYVKKTTYFARKSFWLKRKR
jgi:surface protein